MRRAGEVEVEFGEDDGRLGMEFDWVEISGEQHLRVRAPSPPARLCLSSG